MDYISDESYRSGMMSSCMSDVNLLHTQVNSLLDQVRNMSLDITILKKKIKELEEDKEIKKKESVIEISDDDTWFHPFGD